MSKKVKKKTTISVVFIVICYIFAYESFINWRWQRINLTEDSYYELRKFNLDYSIFYKRNTTYLYVASNALLRLNTTSIL